MLTVPVVKQLLSDITRFIAQHFPMSGAHIQAWIILNFLAKLSKGFLKTS